VPQLGLTPSPTPSGSEVRPLGTGLQEKQALRLGVFGGAFDPPHVTHVALAELAVRQLALDKLLIIPTGQAWHKSRPLSAAWHRVAMCELAFGGMPKAQLDLREIRRDGPTYTADTLDELRLDASPCDLFLIMGGDQARAFDTWHAFEAILKNATICIASRAISERIDANFSWQSLPEAHVEHLLMPLSPVSATDIRQRVNRGEDVQALVGSAVARYIAEQRLYTDIYTD
jgi:nicotinate-nucleotide adenylyltransferase